MILANTISCEKVFELAYFHFTKLQFHFNSHQTAVLSCQPQNIFMVTGWISSLQCIVPVLVVHGICYRWWMFTLYRVKTSSCIIAPLIQLVEEGQCIFWKEYGHFLSSSLGSLHWCHSSLLEAIQRDHNHAHLRHSSQLLI